MYATDNSFLSTSCELSQALDAPSAGLDYI